VQPPASPRANINLERMAHLGLSCRFGRERVVLAPAVRVSEPPRPGGGARRVTQLPRGAVRRPGVDDLVHAIGSARWTPTVDKHTSSAASAVALPAPARPCQ